MQEEGRERASEDVSAVKDYLLAFFCMAEQNMKDPASLLEGGRDVAAVAAHVLGSFKPPPQLQRVAPRHFCVVADVSCAGPGRSQLRDGLCNCGTGYWLQYHLNIFQSPVSDTAFIT